MTTPPAPTPPSRVGLGMAAFGLLALAATLFLHLYWGLLHDAVLYTLQGLAHSRPALYVNDIFLRYGSQDRYSAFGAIYGLAIGALGVDHAASLLTLLSQIALFFAAWWLSRRLMPQSVSLLAVALFGILELPYGGGGAFHVTEDFLTPRLLSEALVLGALGATLQRRDAMAIALLLIASLVHPVMALAGIVSYIALHGFTVQHPLRFAAGGLAVALLLVLSSAAVEPSFTFSRDWLQLAVGHAPYLTLNNWASLDWSRQCPAFTTLCVLLVTSQDAAARRLAMVVLGAAITGLLLALIGGDWLHIALVLQVQPWRWTWLLVALGTLMLPMAIARLWELGIRGRSTLALLLTVYLFQDEMSAPWMALLTIGMAWVCVSTSWLADPRRQRFILAGTLGLLLLALSWDIANRFVYAKLPYIQFAGLPGVSYTRRIARGSFVPAMLLGAWWLAAFYRPTALRLRAMTACGALALMLAVPLAAWEWAKVAYPASVYRAFDTWRDQIPPGTEVLWAGSPLKVWIYLQRPNYYSDYQLSTTLFSQAAGTILWQRYAALSRFLQSEQLAGPAGTSSGADTALTLAQVCLPGGPPYVVTHHAFPERPVATLPEAIEPPFRGLKLFRCEPPN